MSRELAGLCFAEHIDDLDGSSCAWSILSIAILCVGSFVLILIIHDGE